MPILDEKSLEFLSHSPEQTERLGVRLGAMLKAGDFICLDGDLGSGKTVLAQGIARGWGALDHATSPSYVLINEYRRADSQRLFHIDAFRIKNLQEFEALGVESIFETDAPVIIEWPRRVLAALPARRMWIFLAWVDDSRRRIRIEVNGPRYEQLLLQFRQQAFGG
jgi:tRNA threonylcarbamoyladenosine biosynthesis protein TsaE